MCVCVSGGGGGDLYFVWFVFSFGGEGRDVGPCSSGTGIHYFWGNRDLFSLDRGLYFLCRSLYISSILYHLPFYLKINSQVSKYQRVIHLNCSKKRLRGHPNIVQFYSAASLNEKETEHGMSEYLILTELCSGKA